MLCNSGTTSIVIQADVTVRVTTITTPNHYDVQPEQSPQYQVSGASFNVKGKETLELEGNH